MSRQRRSWNETVSKTFDGVHLIITVKRSGEAKYRWEGDPANVTLKNREIAADFMKRYFAQTHEACYAVLWGNVSRTKPVEDEASDWELKLPEIRQRVRTAMGVWRADSE